MQQCADRKKVKKLFTFYAFYFEKLIRRLAATAKEYTSNLFPPFTPKSTILWWSKLAVELWSGPLQRSLSQMQMVDLMMLMVWSLQLPATLKEGAWLHDRLTAG